MMNCISLGNKEYFIVIVIYAALGVGVEDIFKYIFLLFNFDSELNEWYTEGSNR